MKQQIVKRHEYVAYAKSLIAASRSSILDIENDINDCLDKLEYAKEMKDSGLLRVMKAEIRILRKKLRRERRNLKDSEVLLVLIDRKLL